MNQDKQAAIIVIILVVITISVVAFLLSRGEDGISRIEYNDYEIQEIIDGEYRGYRTTVFINGNGPFFMNTRYNPEQLEDIVIEKPLRPFLDNRDDLFIHVKGLNDSFQGETSIAAIEFDGLIERFFSIPVKYEGNSVSCDEATDSTLVADFRLSNRNHISYNNNCIIIEGEKQEDFIRGADRIIFHLLGIMEN